jgi:uncharacterized membrane protein
MAPRFANSRGGRLATSRVEAFSDGVMAVALTLLVLDLKLPPGLGNEAELWSAVLHLAPSFAAWVVSFAFVMTSWINHHYFFAAVRVADRSLLWLNGLLLLSISLLPFPAGLVGEYPGFAAPLALLSGTMLVGSLTFAVMRYYALFHGHLMREAVDSSRARAAIRRTLIGPALYAVALMLAFVWLPGAVGAQIIALALFVFAPPDVHTATHGQEATPSK